MLLAGFILLAPMGIKAQDSQTFLLKNGQKIIGTVIAEEDSGKVLLVSSSFGELRIRKSDLVKEKVLVYLKSGEIIEGSLLDKNDSSLEILSSLGQFRIDMDKVERLKFPDSPESREAGVISQDEAQRWFYGEEQLIDIFFDPTGYILEKNQLYFSGLSWGYGMTDNLMLTSKWSGYIFGDINARFKYQVLYTRNLDEEYAAAIGVHFHLRGTPSKFVYRLDSYDNDYYQWESVGDIDSDSPWAEFFTAYTISTLNSDERGRSDYTFGASITTFKGEDLMPRAYFAYTNDIRRNLKFLAELYWDPYYASFFTREIATEKNSTSLGIDFGFIYAFNEKFRMGIHYNQPWLVLYYKL